MVAENRRQKILEIIRANNEPLTGSYLAEMFGVSRQVIVQDIAVLRAAGNEIIATPQGYMVPKHVHPKRYYRVVACKHSEAGIQDELMTVVDLGGTVVDVIVDHRVYGEFKAQLMVKSPSDARSFVEAMKREGAEPLSSLTGEIHLHTIEADTPELLDRIEKALDDRGFLIGKD